MWCLFWHLRRPGVRLGRLRRQLDAHRHASSARLVRRGADIDMIRVILPYHLRTLANVSSDVQLEVAGPVTTRALLDALEARYPVLRGTIRDHDTGKRRPMLRFFACEEDFSHEPVDTPLPEQIASGAEPFWIIAAIAGG